MKKRRSTVYVRPGKDVTLYVPAETPPEVIDYLNRLKEEGTFSQGVMEILTKYVQQQGSVQARGDIGTGMDDSLSAMSDDLTSPGWPSEEVSTERHPHTQPLRTEEPRMEPPVTMVSADPAPRKKLNLTQIFRQAQRNSGKLLDYRQNQ